MEGRNGDRGQAGSSSYTISSSSGTLSTAYTSSTGSRLSSFSLEAAMHFDFKLYGEKTEEEEEEEDEQDQKAKHIKSLVQEFFGSPQANCCRINGAALERWLTELGVEWVLHVADGASAGKHKRSFDAWIWIRALTEITDTIRLMTSLFPVPSLLGLDIICEEEESVTEGENQAIRDQCQFAQFIQEAMLKMLAFVDVIATLDPNITWEIPIFTANGVPAPYQKINILFRVRDALSDALSRIQLPSHSPPSEQIGKIQGEMVSLLSAKDSRASEAIWRTMEEIWSRIMESMEDPDDSSRTHTAQVSSDIHKATLSLTSHIRYLWDNYWPVNQIVFEAGNLGKHVAEVGGTTNPLARLTIQMVSCLEEKLDKISQSFPDQGLRFLFLINNSCYISQQLHTTYGRPFLDSYFKDLTRRVEGHIQSYLRVSWAPVLSCLCRNFLCLARYTPSSRFQLEFMRTYTAQKLWKVPDPEVRGRLRKAIAEKVIKAFTNYLEDSSNVTARVTPQQMVDMLQDLFEG